MKLHEIQHTLADLTKEYYAIGRTLDFEEWLTAQVMQLKKERDKAQERADHWFAEKEKFFGRVNGLEEWLSEYRDQLKRENVFHKNQGIINAINELLNGTD